MRTTTLQKNEIEEDTEQPFDLTKAFKLRYKNCLSIQEIADQMGVAKSTIHQRLKKLESLLPNPHEVENYRLNKVQMLDSLEYKVYEKMLDEDKLKDASFNNLAYGFQNICTQNRLEKGLATERLDIQTISASLDDLNKREQDIIKDIQVRMVQDVVSDTDKAKQ